MRIALLQMTGSSEPKANLSALLSYAETAADQGAEVIFSPECSNIMEMDKQAILGKTVREQDDPMVAAIQDFCARRRIFCSIGSVVVKAEGGKLANRSLVVDPTGTIIARYDKIHLFDVDLPDGESYRESRLYQAGQKPVMAPLHDQAWMGLSVCYDLRFPYLYTYYAQQGANILSVPAAFTVPTGQAHWHVLLRARAIENNCFVIAAAQCGQHSSAESGKARLTYGHSLVVNPWGEIVYDAGGRPDEPNVGAHMVDLDLTLVQKVRQKIPNLTHVKPIKSVC